MKLKVIETFKTRDEVKGKPVEVRHAFPDPKAVPDCVTLVSAQPDGTVADQERDFAREQCRAHLLRLIALEFEQPKPAAAPATPPAK